jgi:hypothetical protein
MSKEENDDNEIQDEDEDEEIVKIEEHGKQGSNMGYFKKIKEQTKT